VVLKGKAGKGLRGGGVGEGISSSEKGSIGGVCGFMVDGKLTEVGHFSVEVNAMKRLKKNQWKERNRAFLMSGSRTTTRW